MGCFQPDNGTVRKERFLKTNKFNIIIEKT